MLWNTMATTGQGPGPRDSHSAVLVGRQMIVFGGTNGSRMANDLHVLDLGDQGVCFLYSSGDRGDRFHGDVDVLDTDTRTWTKRVNVPFSWPEGYMSLDGVGDQGITTMMSGYLMLIACSWTKLDISWAANSREVFSHCGLLRGLNMAYLWRVNESFGFVCREDERPLNQLLVLILIYVLSRCFRGINEIGGKGSQESEESKTSFSVQFQIRAEPGFCFVLFMEGFGFSDSNSAVRKKRVIHPVGHGMTHTHLPITLMFHPYHPHHLQKLTRASSTHLADCESSQNMMKNEDGGLGESDEASNNCSFRGSNEQRHSGVDSRRSSEGVLAPANWKSTTSSGHVGGFSDGVGNESKVKVKLKVGGITRTINAKSASDGASAVGSSSSKSSRFPDPRQKLIEENLDDNRSFTSGKGSGLRGVPWKDFSRSGLNVRKTDGLRGENLSSKQTDQYEPVRKSKRVPKKRLLDGVLDDGGEDDDEIRYLEKVKTLKISTDYGAEFEDEEGGSRKQRKISRVLKRNVDGLYDVDAGDHGSTRFGKEGKKSKSGRVSEDTDYVEEEELGSDGDPTSKNKKPRKELADLSVDSKKEMTVTTRQRALQTGKDASSGFPSLIEFPNGAKRELTEVEQQLKRAEALQRRRMQVEKANRESEAEAIRKILGQDSTRKKREDKLKKRQEEMAQEKAANAMVLASDHVRWVMGPSGTTVTFPDEMGLPSIFDSKPCSYPPPREKCAAPSCTNPYKYRDSESKLPLCSLPMLQGDS
ncbi:hypothetical protein NC652_030432 [Populus alba x Populus x berolinensis]|nr:hypothetical protein NC652_030432 [Populus alba x Populus x berolinensis]